ncbi:MAG: hypothetical protein IPJ89_01060 [Candidatus Iainarchaeum archaeon]|uniref:Uncharacterized protein n=1 Tax=Candidatus Iainarchaeum sp. TaxID=3101447 RepID=A0A7T9DK97_9ARCH|nr:MAG: hypothetical protein IPJ89_01060 [Candidatus Diapherotrites archaeon]
MAPTPSSVRESKRGQAAIPDVMFAVTLFMIILAGIFYFQGSIERATELQFERKTLDTTTANVAEYLVKNPGTPSDWELLSDYNAVQFFGLALRDRVLDPDKLVAFVNLGNTNYDFLREKLRLSHFNYYIEFTGGANVATGLAPIGSVQSSVVRRFVTVNGIETTVTVTIYAT